MGTSTVTKPSTRLHPGTPGSGSNGHRGGGPFYPGDGPDQPRDDEGSNPEKSRIGIWVVLVGVFMLFVAISSAYLFRMSGVTPDDQSPYQWKPLYLPRILWVNTAVLLFSSVALEVARRGLKHERFIKFNRWIKAAALFGALFLVGQLIAWSQLARQGIYLSSNPHSSFFYVLTCLHGLHLVGGLIGLSYAAVMGHKFQFDRRLDGRVYATSLYWHFMDLLWIYLFVLLFFVG